MTTPFWCLLVAIFLPYVLAGTTVYFKNQQFGEIDVKNPREQSAGLKGKGARANAAQLNAWEALAVFATAVIVAHLAGADPAQSALASLVFVVTRLLHAALYIADQAPLRTGAFLVGLGSCAWLFGLAVLA